MYAQELTTHLHRALASPRPYPETQERFERLRGYALLPAGRENAARRLTDEQIASAVLGFVPADPGWAGHVSLVVGKLRAVGGAPASIAGATSLLDAVTAILASEKVGRSLVSLTVSIMREINGDEYGARCVFKDGAKRKTVSFVSSMAVSLLGEGADRDYDHERIWGRSARQLVLDPDFFRELRREVAISRKLDRPLRTDWSEYENEEAEAEFHRKLGARPGSTFLNLAVDANVTWPKEPVRVEFGGHRFVMFPPTKDSVQSVSIDLVTERLSSDEARTLLNRFLSILSWCEDRHAVLKDGWSGNPIPVPAPRANEAFQTASHWLFQRTLPNEPELLMRLAYYREGLNARRAGLAPFAVLSFYKVFEIRKRSRSGIPNPTVAWIAANFIDAVQSLDPRTLTSFHTDRGMIPVERYLAENCRVAAAHASEAVPSDADASLEIRRLHLATDVIRALARHHIVTEYGLSESYLSD